MTAALLLVADDRAHRTALASALAEVVEVDLTASVDGAAEAIAAVSRLHPDVVLVDHSLAGDPPALVVRVLLDHDPTLAVVLWSAAPAPEGSAAALDLGCRAVVARPLAIDEATAALLGAAAWSDRIRTRHDPRTEAGTGTVVALLGAKGGVGTSTLAVQLARAAADGGAAPVVVDLDLGGPDLTGLLDLAPQRSILDLVPVAEHLDDRYLADALHHHPSGVRLLPGPPHGERADELDDDVTRRILAALGTHARAVVVDCGSRLDDATAVALEVADHALVVVTPDVPCLLAARRHLSALDRLSIRQDDEVSVLINRRTRRAELTAPVVGRTLGVAVSPTVPDRPAFGLAAADARPESLVDRPARRALARLARSLDLLDPAPAPGPGRRWRRPRDRGQAAIELLGLLPVVLVVALAALQALLTASAATAATDAARAAARAEALGQDPEAAARAALPHRLADDLVSVSIDRSSRGAGRVHATVRLRTPGPLVGIGPDRVTGDATFQTEER